EWAIRQACATAAQWPENLRIAVNLSPAQFRSPGLLQAIVGALAAAGMSPNRLELEITETVLLQDSEATLTLLYRLRELGVRIAMDDFGTGYSSLGYLQSFPFDKLKIDRLFVSKLPGDTQSVAIVQAVVAMGRSLGMRVLAEGVETEVQADLLKRLDCDDMQGFLVAHPMAARDV